jgi:carbon monoxide dehydrogenase subunit G
MLIEGAFELGVPRDALYKHIVNPELMASCIPGCEAVEQIGPASYRARVTVGLGAIKAHFNLVVEITEETPPESVISVTRGEEGGKASIVTAHNKLSLTDLGGGRTRLQYVSEVSITGRFGKFALGVMKKKAQSMGEEFAGNLSAKISPAANAAVDAANDGGAATSGSWMLKLKNAFNSLFGWMH